MDKKPKLKSVDISHMYDNPDESSQFRVKIVFEAQSAFGHDHVVFVPFERLDDAQRFAVWIMELHSEYEKRNDE